MKNFKHLKSFENFEFEGGIGIGSLDGAPDEFKDSRDIESFYHFDDEEGDREEVRSFYYPGDEEEEREEVRSFYYPGDEDDEGGLTSLEGAPRGRDNDDEFWENAPRRIRNERRMRSLEGAPKLANLPDDRKKIMENYKIKDKSRVGRRAKRN